LETAKAKKLPGKKLKNLTWLQCAERAVPERPVLCHCSRCSKTPVVNQNQWTNMAINHEQHKHTETATILTRFLAMQPW